MALERFSLENYRCFADRQEVELRPLTVVLGKNNSGKSALVRAPRVLETGLPPLAELGVPLNLSQLSDDPPDFADLIHSQAAHRPVELGMRFTMEYDASMAEIEATIQNVTEWNLQVVSSLRYDSLHQSLRMSWVVEDTDPGVEHRRYLFSVDGSNEAHGSFGFAGLLPVQTEEYDDFYHHELSVLEGVRIPEIRYTGPFRTPPSRTTRLHERSPRGDESGRGTDGIIVYDKVRGDGRLIAKVNEYLLGYLPGWELDVAQRYGAYSVGLRSVTESGMWVSAVDSGTGVTQVLPLLVRRAQDELQPPFHDILEIIEEPELHLHPFAQAGLADLYIGAVKTVPQVRFLIETHSETFLLRLRRRVAEGNLDPEKLVLYFVDHDGKAAKVKRINVDELGNVDFWPEGIFSENFEEAKALSIAQADRLGVE